MKEFVLIIISSSIIFISLFNDSLKEYYEVNYHKNIDLDFAFFKKSNEFKEYLEYNVFFTKVKEIKPQISNENNNKIKVFHKCYLDTLYMIKLIAKQEIHNNQKLVLSKDNGVILLGDSLMQGVGLSICNSLKKQNIKCENLAKQSTGLLRKKYYDYAKVLKSSLQESAIKNVVILVGVNDLWNANENNKVLKFGDSEWKSFYTKRIDELVKITRDYNANIFWYELPVVKNDEQNEKIKILNEVFYELAKKNNYQFIKLDSVLTEHFDFYIKIDGKSKRIRSNDGIHFTPLGYELISQDFFKTVEIQ
ncbi:DUF459 domain-containing protein [Campylobacter sp. RM12654]|uniref:DUF459 domain-containing protein n=1 Tax=Campylobacter sp. RM12654 TaxID=2735738 RepID=UPI0030144EA5|nr:DUF459 domain-containing protein [Campylobacter sp. RM12654]